MLGGVSRGDTIIEVLLAVVVFSLVAIGAMTVMNQGTNSAQRALEITQVKLQIEAQAEALRAAQQAHLANPRSNDTWTTLTALADPSPASSLSTTQCPEIKTGGYFAMNSRTATVSTALQRADRLDDNVPPYSQIVYTADDSTDVNGIYGLWVEKTTNNVKSPGFIDFRIRACWAGPGLNVPMTLQTIVRLYNA